MLRIHLKMCNKKMSPKKNIRRYNGEQHESGYTLVNNNLLKVTLD